MDNASVELAMAASKRWQLWNMFPGKRELVLLVLLQQIVSALAYVSAMTGLYLAAWAGVPEMSIACQPRFSWYTGGVDQGVLQAGALQARYWPRLAFRSEY